MKNKIEIFKYSGINLLIICTITLLLSSIFFFLNISITKFNIFLSILLNIPFLYIFKNKFKVDKNIITKSFFLTIIVLFLAIISMSFIYDRSSDGNTYHKDAVGNLYQGWNPVKESSTEFLKDKQNENYDINRYDIWKDHYAKANWILEANFYKMTNNIEASKALNIILMYILFVLSLDYFYKLIGKKGLILAFLITFNPISCNQIFTFYNDQLGASLLLTLVISLLSILTSKDKENQKIKFLVLSCIFIIITNIKFNIMGYGLIFTFLFMIRYLYLKYKEKDLFNSLKKLFLLYIVLFFISFVVVGYSTYIKNYIDHGNMFFPVYGENSEDIITAQQPKSFISKNNVEKLFIGTFARVNNLNQNRNYEFKIPFTFKLSEIKESSAIDTRLGGFGILSGGLFIISILVLILYFIKSKEKEERINIIIIISSLLLISLLISESWWARYNPSNYLLIIIMCYITLKYFKNIFVNILIVSLITFNSLIILLANSYYSVSQSIKINKSLNQMKNVSISFNLGDMTGIIYNLNDKKINYKIVESKNLNNLTYYKYLNYTEVDNEK